MLAGRMKMELNQWITILTHQQLAFIVAGQIDLGGMTAIKKIRGGIGNILKRQ